MQATYDAIEMSINNSPLGGEIVETGSRETYLADTVDEAIRKFVYTRRLKNGNFKYTVGASGKTVLCGRLGYAFIRAKPLPVKKRKRG